MSSHVKKIKCLFDCPPARYSVGIFHFPTMTIPCVYTDLLQLLLQPIRRHFENRKGPDSRLAEKRSFADFRNIANAIKGKQFHENGNIGYKLILLIKSYV